MATNAQRTLEQRRAATAWQDVREAKGKAWDARYGQLARSAPADIQANGLGQTLAFWRAKKEPQHLALLNDVSDWCAFQLQVPNQQKLLEWIVSTASTDQYRDATREAIAFLGWVKRFAEAEFEPMDDNGR